MNLYRPTRGLFVLTLFCVACLGCLPCAPVAAASCTFTSVNSLNFGVYNVFDASANMSGVGSLRVSCKGGGGPFAVRLSTGQSNRYASRLMSSGAHSMLYNLFTSPARTVVWGDGTGGSSTVMVSKNSTVTLSVYGLIPARQDVAVGVYMDNLVADICF